MAGISPAMTQLQSPRDRHSSFSTWFSAFRKLRPIGCFSVSRECELMKYGPREDAHAKTTAPEFSRAAKRAGADFTATYAALEVGELLKKQEV
jgi:delta-aminolevulinic acid dehydratase/porphobilinogen synthase